MSKEIQCITIKDGDVAPITGAVAEFGEMIECLFGGDLQCAGTLTVTLHVMTQQQLDALPDYEP